MPVCSPISEPEPLPFLLLSFAAAAAAAPPPPSAGAALPLTTSAIRFAFPLPTLPPTPPTAPRVAPPAAPKLPELPLPPMPSRPLMASSMAESLLPALATSESPAPPPPPGEGEYGGEDRPMESRDFIAASSLLRGSKKDRRTAKRAAALVVWKTSVAVSKSSCSKSAIKNPKASILLFASCPSSPSTASALNWSIRPATRSSSNAASSSANDC
mmetsp:Transcript_61764/g.121312  ORF Transcript_61764/g.121312 Transcript_61764/m.121312 type:complete len:214 (+) Transcript_61764:361-1002(+)